MDEEGPVKVQNKQYGHPGFNYTKSRGQYVSALQDDGLYPITTLPLGGMPELKYEQIKEPKLSLFEPYPHEVEPPPEGISLTRPVTPIDEEVKRAPTEFDRLATYIRRRIAAKDDIQHLSLDEQRSLAGILMGEVNGIWPDMRQLANDPFLTEVQNKELQRRITVHIVTVCEKLFKHYINKAQILNSRGIFTGPANISRLKAQLALDASKFLNVLTIRRYIVEDLRKLARGERLEESSKEEQQKMSFKAMLESSRPKQPKLPYKKSREEHINEMHEAMPSLDVSKLYPFLMDLAEEEQNARVLDDSSTTHSRKGVSKRKSEVQERVDIKLGERPASAHVMHIGETLLEEFGLPSKDILSRDSIYHGRVPVKRKDDNVSQTKLDPKASDLKKLMERTYNQDQTDEELPALLQAVKPKRKPLTEMAEQILRKEKEESRISIDTKYSDEKSIPLHEQPGYTSGKLPNKMPVRTSDIRVSDRVCLSSMTLQKHSTLYNDLIDEIDVTTVKNLDRNLFLSEEIKEVYKEIKKTIPHDHLDLENDPMVEPSADYINLSAALASSSLNRKKKERIINPRLTKRKQAPWGEQEAKEWSNIPDDPNKKRDNIPLHAAHGQDQQVMNQLKVMAGQLTGITQDGISHDREYLAYAEMPAAVLERLSRSYSSWFSWWKNTMNSDDFLKYISTQESDFLGTIFHFYNEEAGDDEDDEEKLAALKKKMEKEKEREKYLETIRAQKTEYQAGFWNSNVVMLGGLGQDPEGEVAVVEDQVEEESTAPMKTIQKVNRSQAAVKAREAEEEARRAAKAAEEHVESTQDRLERVWTALRMPDHLRLDMAIKYSSDDYIDKLHDAIVEWEKATDIILKREQIMSKLEMFERIASDPNRFFEKGHRGSSVARLEEAKLRSNFYKKLENIEIFVKAAISTVQENFQDILSFQGRPYLEKLSWDRTEMLYWLQEERRTTSMQKVTLPEIPMKAAHLAPKFELEQH